MLRAVQRGEFTPPRQLDPSIDKALEAVCLKAMAHSSRRTATRRPQALAEDVERWMADEPVSAWREPVSRRLLRWLTRHRTGVTGAAAAVLAGVVGLSAVLAVQTRANAQLSASLSRETAANRALAKANNELTHSKAAVQSRYDLAVAAIKTFHTGVSEDFMLKEEKLKDLRDRLLKSASDFYERLGALLKDDADLPSRRALLQANYELAELTEKVGRTASAMEAHRQVLAAREELATEPGADAEVKTEVGRSMMAVARLHEFTGKTDEALSVYRRSELLLASLAESGPPALAELAACRSALGELLASAGEATEALAAFRLAQTDQQRLATAPRASNKTRRDLADTMVRIGNLLAPLAGLRRRRPSTARPFPSDRIWSTRTPPAQISANIWPIAGTPWACSCTRRASSRRQRRSGAPPWRSG